MNINRGKFTLNNMEVKLNKIVEKYTSDMPSRVSIKLPKLKKVSVGDADKTKKIKLPKLKKVTQSEGVVV